MAKFITTILQNEEVAVGTICVRLAKPEGFTFEAGQTIDVTIPNIPKGDEKGNMRTFSIASDPHDDFLEIATRVRDSAFKTALKERSKDDTVEIEGPFGSFTLHENVARPAVMLVGGIGITPFRSMIRDAAHRSLPHALYLFYSNRRPEDAAFLDELTALGREHEAITVIPTMTDMEHSTVPWEGEQGFVTQELIAAHVGKESNPIYYMAGPQGMVLAMQKMLLESGVSKDDIKFEEFSGY